MNSENTPNTAPSEPLCCHFLTSASVALSAVGAVAMVPEAEAQEAKDAPARKKTFLVVQGDLDDAYIGARGALIQAAKAGHRVVVVTVASDYSSWAATVGREAQVKQGTVRPGQGLRLREAVPRRQIPSDRRHRPGVEAEAGRDLHRRSSTSPSSAIITKTTGPITATAASQRRTHFCFRTASRGYMEVHRCPLILGFSVTPIQTYHFEPDVFYDVTDVIREYMDLIGRIEAIRTGRPLEE